MKKFKTIALSLLAFVLSISVFTGCGTNEMAELSQVDFSKAQTVTIDEVANKVTSENFDAYPYVEYSLVAKNVDLSGISAAEAEEQPRTLADIDVSGRFSFAIPESAMITATSPEDILGYLNGETTLKLTVDGVNYNVKAYVYNSNFYVSVGDMKVKQSIADLINNFSGNNLASLDETDPSGDFMDSFAEMISCLNMPQKVVDGDYTYYKLTFDSTKIAPEMTSLLGNFELIVGFEGDRLCKVYARNGEDFVLSVNFVESTTISQPANADEYLDIADVNISVIMDNEVLFNTLSINLDANNSQTFKLGIANVTNQDVTFSATLCVDNTDNEALNSILENSDFVLNKETNVYELSFDTITLTTDDLVKLYDITLTAPEGVTLTSNYPIDFYFSIGMPQ